MFSFICIMNILNIAQFQNRYPVYASWLNYGEHHQYFPLFPFIVIKLISILYTVIIQILRKFTWRDITFIYFDWKVNFVAFILSLHNTSINSIAWLWSRVIVITCTAPIELFDISNTFLTWVRLPDLGISLIIIWQWRMNLDSTALLNYMARIYRIGWLKEKIFYMTTA